MLLFPHRWSHHRPNTNNNNIHIPWCQWIHAFGTTIHVYVFIYSFNHSSGSTIRDAWCMPEASRQTLYVFFHNIHSQLHACMLYVIEPHHSKLWQHLKWHCVCYKWRLFICSYTTMSHVSDACVGPSIVVTIDCCRRWFTSNAMSIINIHSQ